MNHSSVVRKSIATRYSGTWFRSRLEARWAAYFDRAEIPWSYEPEVFTVNHRLYIPDFKIGNDWVEVKGSEEWLDRGLLADFAEQVEPIVLLGDLPTRLVEGREPAWRRVMGTYPEDDDYLDCVTLGPWRRHERLWFVCEDDWRYAGAEWNGDWLTPWEAHDDSQGMHQLATEFAYKKLPHRWQR